MIAITLTGNPLNHEETIHHLVQKALEEGVAHSSRSVSVRLTLAAGGAVPPYHQVTFRMSVPILKGASRRKRRPVMTRTSKEK